MTLPSTCLRWQTKKNTLSASLISSDFIYRCLRQMNIEHINNSTPLKHSRVGFASDNYFFSVTYCLRISTTHQTLDTRHNARHHKIKTYPSVITFSSKWLNECSSTQLRQYNETISSRVGADLTFLLIVYTCLPANVLISQERLWSCLNSRTLRESKPSTSENWRIHSFIWL